MRTRRAVTRSAAAFALAITAVAALTPSPAASATPACLRLDTGGATVATIGASLGDEVHLRFRHSIYGSAVEEHFRLGTGGLELVRLRYAEPRLVPFYGHEAARRHDDWWIVAGDLRKLSALHVRARPESQVEVAVGETVLALAGLVEPGGLVRLTVHQIGAPTRSCD